MTVLRKPVCTLSFTARTTCLLTHRVTVRVYLREPHKGDESNMIPCKLCQPHKCYNPCPSFTYPSIWLPTPLHLVLWYASICCVCVCASCLDACRRSLLPRRAGRLFCTCFCTCLDCARVTFHSRRERNVARRKILSTWQITWIHGIRERGRETGEKRRREGQTEKRRAGEKVRRMSDQKLYRYGIQTQNRIIR